MRKNLIAMFIILLAVVASFGDGCATDKPTVAECEVKIVELEAKITELGSLVLEANDQWMECLNSRQEYASGYRSVAVSLIEELVFFRPDSTVLIDGILIECANQANWPHNDGVMESEK